MKYVAYYGRVLTYEHVKYVLSIQPHRDTLEASYMENKYIRQ